MKLKQSGFTSIEVVLVIVVIALMGAMGWLVYDRKNTSSTVNTQTSASIAAKTTVTPSTQSYSFKELGISMNILAGWQVKTDHSKEDDVNFYRWTVEKAGADGKISLSSTGFRGGFIDCASMGDPLSGATIKEVASTNKTGLTFLAYSYKSGSDQINRAGIVSSVQTAFRVKNDASTQAVANSALKVGTYYFCPSDRIPGTFLGLNSEAATGYSRNDSIAAITSDSTATKEVQLATTAQSYADIKAMLTSIK